MRILLLGHRDIASNVALSLIVASLPGHRFDVRVSGAVESRGEVPDALRRLSEYEDRLCEEWPSMAAARGAGLLPFPALAEHGGGTFGELAAPNAPEGLEALAACDPDLVISVRYRRILGPDAIAVPRHGVLNLHSGLLPDYRGVMATFWAMLNGESAIGSTLHYIVDAGIDTGPVVGRAPVAADRQKSYLANVLSLYPSGCAMVADAVRRIERGATPSGTDQARRGRCYTAPGASDIARFESAGLRLCDGTELSALSGWRAGRTEDDVMREAGSPANPARIP